MKTNLPGFLSCLVLLGLAGSAPLAFAHCDTLDGPVVKAARSALEQTNVNLVLLWVQKNDEKEIKAAFEKTLAVRKLDPQARDLADMYFFETLVRVHRAGEGAPYAGLKPTGSDLGPAIPAADKALEDGKLVPLYELLTETVHEGLHKNFADARARKDFRKDDVEAGREFVKAYVKYMHYVEGIHEAAGRSGGDHAETSAHTKAHEHK